MLLSSISVERFSADDLTRQQWIFRPLERQGSLVLVLDYYYLFTRPSTRHKFKHTELRYSRIYSRESTVSLGDVTIPADVEAEAYQSFISTIKVAKE